MSEMLQKLVAAGKRSARADVSFVQENYVGNPVGIRCSLAEDEDGNLLGFQSLIRATEGNRYNTRKAGASSAPTCRPLPPERASGGSCLMSPGWLPSKLG